MASRGEGPRSPESADSHARVMTQKRLLLSDSLVWAGVILARAGVQELGFGSGWTYWRRLREWQAAGVWCALHRGVLDELGGRGCWTGPGCRFDSVSVRGERRGDRDATRMPFTCRNGCTRPAN